MIFSARIFDKINKFVGKLVSRIKVKKVYLFGSVARNDFNEGSDIDIAIIGDFKELLVKTRDCMHIIETKSTKDAANDILMKWEEAVCRV
jgi:predicted nucleotidyltransferase